MTLAANGAPRFVRATPADANWDDRFGEPGVTNDIFGAAVNALAVDGSDVYVGGIFTFAGGARHSYVLRWDGRSWHDLSGGIAGAPENEDPEVDALALSGDTLYVGGIFNSVRNGVHVDHGERRRRLEHPDGDVERARHRRLGRLVLRVLRRPGRGARGHRLDALRGGIVRPRRQHGRQQHREVERLVVERARRRPVVVRVLRAGAAR